jgi:hypothetical protein
LIRRSDDRSRRGEDGWVHESDIGHEDDPVADGDRVRVSLARRCAPRDFLRRCSGRRRCVFRSAGRNREAGHPGEGNFRRRASRSVFGPFDPLRLEAGYSYTYRVKASTQRNGFEEDVDGTVVYAVKSVRPDGVARVTCTEEISCSVKSRAEFASGGAGGAGHASFSEHHSTEESTATSSTSECFEIDRYGRTVGADTGGNLPFPVGRMSHLAIEPLPLADENAWTISGDVGIVLTDGAEPPLSPSAGSGGEPLLAREKTTYTIEGPRGPSITVRKTYGFATAAEGDDKPLLTVTGEGDLTFDRQSGVFTSSTMTMRVTVDEDDGSAELASMVQCVLIGVAEDPAAEKGEEKGHH